MNASKETIGISAYLVRAGIAKVTKGEELGGWFSEGRGLLLDGYRSIIDSYEAVAKFGASPYEWAIMILESLADTKYANLPVMAILNDAWRYDRRSDVGMKS